MSQVNEIKCYYSIFYNTRTQTNNVKNCEINIDGNFDLSFDQIESYKGLKMFEGDLVANHTMESFRNIRMLDDTALEEKCWAKIQYFKRRDDKAQTDRQARTVLRRSKRIASRKRDLSKKRINADDELIENRSIVEDATAKVSASQVEPEQDSSKKSETDSNVLDSIIDKLILQKATVLRKALKDRSAKCPRRKSQMAMSLAKLLIQKQEVNTCSLLKDESKITSSRFEHFMQLKNAELKQRLKEKKLSVKGHKADLAARLAKSIDSDGVGEENETQILPPNTPSPRAPASFQTPLEENDFSESNVGLLLNADDVPSSQVKPKLSTHTEGNITLCKFSEALEASEDDKSCLEDDANEEENEVDVVVFSEDKGESTGKTHQILLTPEASASVMDRESIHKNSVKSWKVDDNDSVMDMLDDLAVSSEAKSPKRDRESQLEKRLQEQFDNRLESAKSKTKFNTKDSLQMQSKCKRKSISPISSSTSLDTKNSLESKWANTTVCEEALDNLDEELNEQEMKIQKNPTPMISVKKKPRILKNLVKAHTFIKNDEPEKDKPVAKKKMLVPALEKARILKLKAEQKEKERLKKKQLFEFKLKEKKQHAFNQENIMNAGNTSTKILPKQLTKREEIHESEYELTDGHESDDEDCPRIKKHIPRWATSKNMAKLVRKFRNVDPDSIFEPISMPHLEDLFPNIDRKRLQKLKIRGSSAKWVHDKVNKMEIKKYKKDMNLTSRLFK